MSPRTITITVERNWQDDSDIEAENLSLLIAHNADAGETQLCMELKENADSLLVPPVTMWLDKNKARLLFGFIGAWLHEVDA